MIIDDYWWLLVFTGELWYLLMITNGIMLTAQRYPKMGPDDPKLAQDEPKMAEMSSQGTKNGSKWLQD